MILYGIIEDYKNHTSTNLSNITKKGVGEQTSTQFIGRNTLIRRKLSVENSEFIKSLGFKLKNA
jgi:hypothetical protein